MKVIEEQAEWIDAAFAKNSRKPVPNNNRAGNDRRKCKDSSFQNIPASSETETDDLGITFVPKKHQHGPSEPIYVTGNIRKPVAVRGLLDESKIHLSNGSASSAVTHDHCELMGVLEEEYSVRLPSPDTGKAPRQAVTQITETELMRRRRLLDSHIFEQ